MSWKIPMLVLLLNAMAPTAEEVKKPVKKPALVTEGRKVYELNCIVCHGPTGRGDGQAAAGLDPKPRNFNDAQYMSKRPVETLRQVISEGGQSVGLSPVMIAWKSILTPEQINAVLAYVQSLSQNISYAENENTKGPEPKPVIK